MSCPRPAGPLPAGLKLFVGLYSLALVIVVLWGMARLLPLNSVVVAERRGVGAIRRAFGLTRGLALRIVGVVILFFVVWGVSAMAATTVRSEEHTSELQSLMRIS